MKRLHAKQIELFKRGDMEPISPATIKVSPILETARQILTEARKPLHVDDITDLAISSNRNLGMNRESFVAKLSAALASNVKSKSPSFTKPINKKGRPRKGVYGVKRSASPAAARVPKAAAPTNIGNNFIGKAGEHAAMAELLFWGFNASLMSVDDGIDVVASKDGQYFHIQVKSAAAADGGNRFSFKINRKSFEKHNAINTFYFFVMRRSLGFDYAVLPSNYIHRLIGLGVISGSADYSITIISDDKRRLFRLNNTDDISLYVNNITI